MFKGQWAFRPAVMTRAQLRKKRVRMSSEQKSIQLPEPAMLKETRPILGTRDIQRAIAFYTQRLGSSWPLETKPIHRTTSISGVTPSSFARLARDKHDLDQRRGAVLMNASKRNRALRRYIAP
jgi:hypothetical protein